MAHLKPDVMNRLLPLLVLTLMIAFTGNTTVIASTDKGSTPEGSSDTDMYETLVAEFALYRKAYDTSLHYYFSQSINQKDAYLAERATRLAMHQGKALEMLQASTIWRNRDPANPEAHFFNALAFAFSVKIPQALEQMRYAQMLGHPTDFTRITNIAIKEEQPLDELGRSLVLFTSATPRSADLHLALAILYIHTEQDDAGAHHLDQTIANDFDNSAIYEYVAHLYLEIARPEDALEVMQLATDRHPYDMDLRLKYAFIASRYDKKVALNQFHFMLDINPGHGPTVLNLALLYLETDQFDEAESLFRHQLQINYKPDSAHYYLSQIARIKGDLPKAFKHLSMIEAPKDPIALQLQLIDLEIQQGLFTSATQRIASAQKRADEYQLAQLAMMQAVIERQRGKLNQAHKTLSQAIARTPSAELYYQRALVADQQGNAKALESDLRLAVITARDDTGGEHIEALSRLAILLTYQGYETDALSLLTDAYKKYPSDPVVLDSMGWVLYRMGQLEEALTLIRQAMAQSPDAIVATHLGEVLWMMGKKHEATQVFKEALIDAPDHIQLKETIKRLNVPVPLPQTA